MRSDRLSMIDATHSGSYKEAMRQEFAKGLQTLNSGDFGGAVDAFVKRSAKGKL